MNTVCTAAGAALRPKPAPRKTLTGSRAAPPASSSSAFLAGRDLAVSMLADAKGLRDADQAASRRWYRAGKGQNRFAKASLQNLIARPELVEGFSAVLSAALAEDVFDPAWFVNLPMAEFEAGNIGQDGTEIDTDSAGDEAEAPKLSVKAIGDLTIKMSRARAAVDLLALTFSGAVEVTEHPMRIAGLMGTLQYASRMLREVDDNIEASNQATEDIYWGAFGALSLLSLLEHLQDADGWTWDIDAALIGGVIEAAAASIEDAQAQVRKLKAPQR